MNKTQRLYDIEEAISNQNFTSQSELLQVLISKGHDITQATLSRDLKLLKASKVPQKNGEYQYILPYTKQGKNINILEQNTLRGFISVDFSLNIAVIKTVPAFAHSIAYALDNAEIPGIVGTVSGDNTIMIILKEGTDNDKFKKTLTEKFPELTNRI